MTQAWDQSLAASPPGIETSSCIQAVYWEQSLAQADSQTLSGEYLMLHEKQHRTSPGINNIRYSQPDPHA